MRVHVAGLGLVLLTAASVNAQVGGGNASTPGTPVPTQALARLYVPDGQLRSHLFRVYVTATITQADQPYLVLRRSHAGTKPLEGEESSLEAQDILEGNWTQKGLDGTDVSRTGSLLLFRIPNEPYFEMRPMLRVTPILHWKEGNVERDAAMDRDVNVGDIWRIVVWTGLAIVIALGIVIVLAWWKQANPILLLAAIDGHLSLAQTQVACWTLAVGSVVLGYGILWQKPPDIPTSLIVLMGFSLATGGAGFVGDAKKQGAAAPPPSDGNPLASVGIALDSAAIRGGTAVAVATVEATGATVQKRTWSFGDLLRTFSPGSDPQLSLAKAQMLFWTLLLLVLFVSKSIVDGVLWEIPWPLVGLMGVSQAGYVVPKFMPSTT